MDDGGEDTDGLTPSPANVFVDTSILLNYAQRGIERDHTSSLIEGDAIDIVVGVTVAEELADVQDRRMDIYADLVDYLLAEDGHLDDYDPQSRHPYFQQNDQRHIRNIQMRLTQLDDRAEIQRQLRRVTRMIERRLQYLLDDVVPNALFDQQPGLAVLFALQDAISNNRDRSVIGDAALWAAEGPDSSGMFATMDQADLLDAADRINAALRDANSDDWTLRFVLPTDLLIPTETETPTTPKSGE
ncbi:hypothetical protein [Halarchaeum salinum]